MSRSFLTIALYIAGLVIGTKQVATASGNAFLERLPGASAYAEAERSSLHAPGAIVVLFDDLGHIKSQSITAYGDPIDENVPFRLASLTKPYTAFVVEQLIEEHKVAIDAPIQQYLPWFHTACPATDKNITVRALLDHSSGIPTVLGIPTLFANDRVDGEAVKDGLRSLASSCVHGSSSAPFAYSNVNYNILGSLIATVTGHTYESEVARRIFHPLHLQLQYSWQLTPSTQLARQYTLIFGIPFENHVHRADRMNAPSAGIITSPLTEARWLSTWLGPRGNGVRSYIAKDSSSYAMGWSHGNVHGQPYLWAPAWGPGSVAVAVLIPDKHIGALLMFNAAGMGQFFRMPSVAEGLAQTLLGETRTVVPGKDINEYNEIYTLPLLILLHIGISIGMLTRRHAWWYFGTIVLNASIVCGILVFFRVCAGSIPAGLLFSPGPTSEVLVILTSAVVAVTYAFGKILRRAS